MRRWRMFSLVVGLTSGCGTYLPWSLGVKDDLNVGDTINAPNGGNIGGVIIDDEGNVIVPGDLTVEGDATIGEGDDAVTIPPPPVVQPPPPDDDVPPPAIGELKAILSPPFVGLAGEGSPPASCAAVATGSFGIKVEVKVEGGTGPFVVRFRNYYGAGSDQSGEGREFTFVFDASVPTTECVSSQLRVTDAEGRVKNLFFYLRVN